MAVAGCRSTGTAGACTHASAMPDDELTSLRQENAFLRRRVSELEKILATIRAAAEKATPRKPRAQERREAQEDYERVLQTAEMLKTLGRRRRRDGEGHD